MTPVSKDLPLSAPGLIAVLAAQFLSALADNALLFGALALLRLHHYPQWAQPILQEFFVGAYIVLAPFAGPLADAFPKGRVMLFSNAAKLCGALCMCAGFNPFVAYGLVGVGSACYSPAKYGILSELVASKRLVKANSLMEGSTIAAILIGALAGGMLADWSVTGTLASVTVCYGLAALANLLVPTTPAAMPLASLSPLAMLRPFAGVVRSLWREPDTRFSITGTSLFWGAGSTLRFLLVAWVPVALGIASNRMPAFLNAAVALGIVAGAALAARFVTLDKVERSLPAGVLIGISVTVLSGTTHLGAAFAVMGLIGSCGGFFVVPLNALLQERGHHSVGAGNAIAVQNLGENLAMLLMIGLYTLVLRAGAPVTAIASGFGIFLSLAIAGLWLRRARRMSFSTAS